MAIYIYTRARTVSETNPKGYLQLAQTIISLELSPLICFRNKGLSSFMHIYTTTLLF